MESETIRIEQEDNEDILVNIEQSNEITRTDETLREDDKILNNSVINMEMKTPAAVVVYEPLVPDVTRFSYDVQHGYRIFRELLSDQYKTVTLPFIEPVDVEGLGLWDYHSRIETPMSFKQIESKFKSYLYQSITEIISDLRLILENCYRYNGSSHWISKIAQKLENILDQKLALLNRSLRDKVTLRATMAFRNNKELVPETEELGRRRRSGRSTYLNGLNTEQASRLVNHLILEEEETQKELKRLKEKEKKEANEALMQELNEWEKELFTPNVMKQLHSMWEVPSIGSFLWLFREVLNLPELSYTEFENGFVIPHKSHQMARIFSALLVTPHQRKSLHKKSPMRFSVWEKKLKERMGGWYMMRETEEYKLVARQIGLDYAFFKTLGNSNPLETKSYVDLTLHQRVLIMKALCDECLEYDYQLRDSLGNTETTPFHETFLGHDEANCSYIYFSIFDATDIRIYKQSPLPSPAEWYRKWTANSKPVSEHVPSGRSSQSRSSKSQSKKSASKSRGLSTSIEEGFQLVCHDVETLRALCEQFADHPTTSSEKKRRGRPRKRSEKELHNVLTTLLEDLGSFEGKYSKARIKGMVSLMKQWKAVEEPSDSENESVAASEDNDQNDDQKQRQESAVVLQQSEITESENSNLWHLAEKRPGGENTLLSATPDDTSREDSSRCEGDGESHSLVTRSRNKYRKRTLNDDEVSTPVSSPALSETNTVFESDVRVHGSYAEEASSTNTASEHVGTNNDLHNAIASKTELVREINGLTEKYRKVDDVMSKTFEKDVRKDDVMSAVSEKDNAKDASRGMEPDSGDSMVIEDVKENNMLKDSMTLRDGSSIGDSDGYMMTNGDIDNDTDNTLCENEISNMDVTHVKPQEINEEISIKSCYKTGNNMDMLGNGDDRDIKDNQDIRDNRDIGDNSVYQNGRCDKLEDACNGAPFIDGYEPATKRHCSGENSNTASLTTSNELATKLENSSLGASHQCPVKTTMNDDTPNHVMSASEVNLVNSL